jgi:hypothetical protein
LWSNNNNPLDGVELGEGDDRPEDDQLLVPRDHLKGLPSFSVEVLGG